MDNDNDGTLNILRRNEQHADADQTRQDLPDQVDTDDHAGLLSTFGIDPADLIAKFTGGQAGLAGVGGALGKLL